MNKTLGIRHIALRVKNFEQCLKFYTDIVGMDIDWKPDSENAYLTNGFDNLALHFCDAVDRVTNNSKLDHFGILLSNKQDVDIWYSKIKSHNIPIYKDIKDHRDGSRSFYCCDPDGNILQLIWHPQISNV
tara:strand:+ start:6095 stop:6484 length:390 start_codon:yes stop_codon:yes gene_type:complete